MKGKLDLIFFFKQVFIKELDREKKDGDIKSGRHVNTKDLYFNAKIINECLEYILSDNRCLVYFLHRFRRVFEEYSALCLKEEEINSLALLSLFFTFEALKKEDNFELINEIRHVDIRKVERVIEENLDILYFS